MKKNTLSLIISVIIIAVILIWARNSALKNKPETVESQQQRTGLPGQQTMSYSEVMNSLSQNMGVWEELSPAQKEFSVNAVIKLFEEQGQATISRDAGFYVRQIDQALENDAGLRQLSLDRVVFLLSVMAYDFNNGQDPDALAKEVLGPEMYAANKQRREQAASLGQE